LTISLDRRPRAFTYAIVALRTLKDATVGATDGRMTDNERRELQGWARVLSAGWFILWLVTAITIYRVNPRRYLIAIQFGLIALPGMIAAVAIGRRSG
jgi:hypothetical protein